MKPKLITFLLIASIQAMSQSINSGNYAGECMLSLLPNQKVPSIMSLKVEGDNVTGTVTLSANGSELTYKIRAKKNDKIYEGKIAEASGELDLRLANISVINPSKKGIYLEAHQFDIVILSGEFQKNNGTTPTAQKPSVAQGTSKPAAGVANLPRDARLVGVWESIRQSRAGVKNQKRLGLYEDGRMEIVTRTSAVTYSGGYGVSFDDGWEQATDVQNLINSGARWFTKNGTICFKLADGKEVPFTYYFVESVGAGKTNLFLQRTPNQEKADESFRKIK